MDYSFYNVGSIPKLTRLKTVDDIASIEFTDGVAEVEVPVELLDAIPLKHFERLDSPRLERILTAIRHNGYSSLEPIICRVGAMGNWVVVDGGHRITAAKRVSHEFFTNIFGEKVRDLTFVLFQTPMSYSKLKPRTEVNDNGPDRRHRELPAGRRKRKDHRNKKKRG